MIALLKFSPIFLFGGMMIVSNIPILSNYLNFSLDISIIAFIATLYAAIIAIIVEKLKVNDIIEAALDNIKNINIVLLILLLAYAMAEVFMSTGVGASIISIALKFGVSSRTVAPLALLVTAALSIATGTSWGTFAACAPIFLWLSHIVGGNIPITVAAIAGGSCFGDNIGLISDTTVVSCGVHNVEVVHRVRNQGVWSLICLGLAFVITLVVSSRLPGAAVDASVAIDAIPADALDALRAERPAAIDLLEQVKTGVPLYMIIPLLIVFGLAIYGLPTLICLILGIASSCILGMIAGTVPSLMYFFDLLLEGFVSAGSWIIVVALWVSSFGGIMLKMDAFKPLAKFVVRISRNVRQLMFWNGVLSLLGTAAYADDMPQILTVGPIIKNITEENVEGSEEAMYNLALRNATFSDAMCVYGSQLIPWHVFLAFYVGIASSVFPLHDFTVFDIIKYNYLSWLAVISILILTLTGLDRFIPLFRMASEPEVRFKKELEEKNEETILA